IALNLALFAWLWWEDRADPERRFGKGHCGPITFIASPGELSVRTDNQKLAQALRELNPDLLADPSPSFSPPPTSGKPVIHQLVGEICLVCRKRIDCVTEGRLCSECGCAVHHQCFQPCPASASGPGCSWCGGDPTTRLPPDYLG